MYSQISSFHNLLKSYYKARRNKRYRRRLQKIELDFENRLLNISFYLKNKTYQTGQYHRFIVFEPKRRRISAPAFIDRIVHHAIMSVIEPLFEDQFVDSSFACRKDKGTHFGMLRISETYKIFSSRYDVFYALKCDIKQYFANIDHQILFKLFSQTVTCVDTLNLIKTIVDSYQDSPGKGIPIGNLTSQLFANIYLHQLDLYLQNEIKETNYFRYMDDFIILSSDKEYLKRLRIQIQTFIHDNLKLELHPLKANIFRADRGIDFLGYFIKKDVTLLRRKTLRRYKKRHKRRLKLLKEYKLRLKNISSQSQLSLFSSTTKTDDETIILEDKIINLKRKLRSSRNSLKGFLRYSEYKRLPSGGVKVNNITIPGIFSRKKV